MKRLLLLALTCLAAFNLQAQNPPKRELRGVWISTHLSLDWPNRTQTPAQQQAALLTILNHNKATGMNAAYFQVRSQSDAMYPSTLEPWSYYLTNNQGTPPSPLWDPLQFAIDETHKRGIEFHAWINPYRAVATLANAGNTAQYAATHVSRTHPEWMLTVGTVQILNPGLPAVRDHVTNVIVDIIRRYDVDGIHFDDYFYPNGSSGDDAAYNADPRGFPATTAGRADWRRDNVNMLIKRVNDSINTIKPWVKFGVSPSGIYRSSTDPSIGSPTSAGALQHYSALFADSKKWIQSGWVDYLTPQVYWYIGQTGSDYKLLVPWWNNNSFGRHIYIGLADYKVNTAGWMSRSEIPNQLRLNRSQPNVYGQTHFRHAFLVSNPLNYRDSLRTRFYNKPALMPTMPWKDNTPAAAPSTLAALTNPDNSVLLTWNKPSAAVSEMDKAKRFAIYRSEQKDMDLEDANNLLAITDKDESNFTDNTVPAGTFYYYSVTSLDRLQNESTSTNTASNDQVKPVVITQNISRVLTNGSVTIAAEEIDNGSSDNWGIQSISLSKTSFDCSNIGENSVMLTVMDKAGNLDSAEAIVTIIGTVPEPAISVSRSDNTYTGLAQNTIALGYGAQSLTLTASNPSQGSGNTNYTWTAAEGLISTNAAGTEFTPTMPGTYTLVVEAQNEFGCTASTSVVITVIDVRCDGNKVMVCSATGSSTHPNNQICIAKNAVASHLQKGGSIGACADQANISASLEETAEPVLRAYPNPFSTYLNVTFSLPTAERRVVLEIYDLAGNRLKRVYAGNTEANKTYDFPVDASDFQGKIFNVRLVSKGKAYNFKVVKE